MLKKQNDIKQDKVTVLKVKYKGKIKSSQKRPITPRTPVKLWALLQWQSAAGPHTHLVEPKRLLFHHSVDMSRCDAPADNSFSCKLSNCDPRTPLDACVLQSGSGTVCAVVWQPARALFSV